jgi:type II secretory pathway pseudopilin PulG
MIRTSYQKGFTYVGLILFIAILATVSATSVQIGVLVYRRQAEQALLLTGKEIRSALISYANNTPIGKSPHPQQLQDLLKDPRFSITKRHLRKIYADPITGTTEWGLIYSPDGKGIIGVFSQSAERPIKSSQFAPEFIEFNEKKHYYDWHFTITSH